MLAAVTSSPFSGCRFVIGREREGVQSEVARLINESLEMDKTSRKVCFLHEEFLGCEEFHMFSCTVYCVFYI